MSMIAHGYGFATYGSPQLVFSNTLWGYIVRAIPTINGVLGYSLATVMVLLAFGWMILYFLLRLGAGYIISLLTVTLLLAKPTLFPQFTMNAGLLTFTAVIGWQVYARFGGVYILTVACLLAFTGYLIRDTEFLLVLGVALPLLPWRTLRELRQMQIAFLLLAVVIASAAAFDRWSYSGPEWQNFMELNSARIPFTDYDAGWYLKQHPEVLARYGYSQNDVDLINNWFFVDPQIANPKSLNAMLAELGSLSMQEGGIQSGFEAIKSLSDPSLLPLILSALLLLVIMPARSVIIAWVLCLSALFVLGVMGRPGILRVYVPLMSLLLVAPFIIGQYKEGARKWVALLAIFLACVGNAYVLIPKILESELWAQQVQRNAHGLPAGVIVSWGAGRGINTNTGGFPSVFNFPVLSNDINSRSLQLYGLNTFTHAPFSVANTEKKAGHDMLERLQTATGVQIMSSHENLEMLRIFCDEHLNGQLVHQITYQTRSLSVQQVRCKTGT